MLEFMLLNSHLYMIIIMMKQYPIATTSYHARFESQAANSTQVALLTTVPGNPLPGT